MNDAPTAPDFTEHRLKYLSLVQDVVSRMASTSASVKRVAIIVVGAAAAIAARGAAPGVPCSHHIADLPLLAIILVAIFWAIDARYVQQERWFRDVYERAASEPPEQRPSLSITPTADIRSKRGYVGSFISWSTGLYHGALIVFLLLTWRFLG
ncbi:hypothetical protein ACFOGJ_18090 [Marinibaculum pumilum]|uniref:Uncharacterized protein n=1 Tax=Marinibaculum pumilum TaxID=1766165 RepID=A0ABV7L3F8_9PROT